LKNNCTFGGLFLKPCTSGGFTRTFGGLQKFIVLLVGYRCTFGGLQKFIVLLVGHRCTFGGFHKFHRTFIVVLPPLYRGTGVAYSSLKLDKVRAAGCLDNRVAMIVAEGKDCGGEM
jgi:hypothetical protein